MPKAIPLPLTPPTTQHACLLSSATLFIILRRLRRPLSSLQPPHKHLLSAANTAIQNLPNLSALWQGTYTLYDPNSTTLTVLKEGQVTLGLTQNKNEYQINGYMTVNNWEIADENKKGRVLATATYTDSSTIDFISVIVKFYPDLPNDEEPTSDSVNVCVDIQWIDLQQHRSRVALI